MNSHYSFADRLTEAVRRRGTPVIVGLDPRPERLPQALVPAARLSQHSGPAIAEAMGKYCREVIDVIAELVAAVKPNAAFFEAHGVAGMQALCDVNRYAQERGLLVILDGKRGDIGSTAEAYAQAYLTRDNPWHSDALTVNPFLGSDSLEPMIELADRHGCGTFTLVKTSNPGSGEVQDVADAAGPIYRQIAARLETLNIARTSECGYGPCGAVVGATYPEQLVELRMVMPRAWFLIPGVGAQGAVIEQLEPAFDSQGLGALINSSRGIIYAFGEE